MWNGAPGSSTASAAGEGVGKRIGLEEGAVARRVHVGEVEHGADEVDLRRDCQDVVDRAEVAHATHHLDAERDEAVLRLEPLAQVPELVDDVGDRLLVVAAEEEARMEDDQPRAAGLGEPAVWSSIPSAILNFLPRSAWPMKAASGACTESATSAASAAAANSGAAS